ncbi:MAG: hypothetical protein HON68_02190 [Gammaproteobacteria bacterium]|jgi:hypothetical protein|nr:hypothetical protein [Gammaproteobacteria bacterium]MBT3490089.1 hypothetical protein [Gammaproteobacteria bacterium]MBT3717491.1 hypothetical protein [Gammaproteobacteria bacterium]MBT3844365.1 hypothetical protein [Gammaproteobacteria bacterium]MBT3892715.1 hypothetical protein [Gammaproteobacteria bacterium]
MARQKEIPDLSATDISTVQQTINERFQQEMAVELGDAEIRLHPDDRELATCPLIYWESPEDNSKFFITKTGINEFRCQFFYRGYQQYGTGKDKYDNIGDCAIAMLQVHHEYEQKKAAGENN